MKKKFNLKRFAEILLMDVLIILVAVVVIYLIIITVASAGKWGI